MYQNAYARSLKLPTVRYLIDYNGYSEGWATYIENNAWQYAEASDSEKISLQLQSINSRITMILICLADIGIHYDGWDRAKFADVMSNYFDLDAEQLDVYKRQGLHPCFWHHLLYHILLDDRGAQAAGNEHIHLFERPAGQFHLYRAKHRGG